MEQFILCEKREWGTLVTLNRPQALNALNDEVLRQLDETLRALNADPAVPVVIITGAGEKSFVAGADIAAMKDMTPEDARQFSLRGQAVMNRIANMRGIVIAAVNGFALGGGCELAMACDIRVASTKARFGIPEVSLGVIPGFGGTQRLSRLAGRGKALELMATGSQIGAEEALRLGLVNHVVQPEELFTACEALAKKIAANSADAVALGKQSIYAGIEMDLERGLAYEAGLFALTFAGSDQKEGMSAFLEKRAEKHFRNK